ncbi:AICARFT/IMPCHase bienzyme [Peptostreptococcaceae bacterium AS15]|nr:AICARFT/IMPCHase bienzyme [Peptostreptococcaceae bacterium AS15]
MKEFQLKYGCNPNQKSARLYMKDDADLPFEILNGNPGYINFLDAFNAYQLVKEVKQALNLPCATSFKHVSPTSVALGIKLDENLKRACFVDDIDNLDDSPIACAYARARGTDRMSSFGDFIALSDKCDVTVAKIISREVSDGIIAPSYDDEALKILKAKKKGRYNIIKIDENYKASSKEIKQVFGVIFEQDKNDCPIDESLLENIVTKNKDLPDKVKRDFLLSMITLKYTQSNSVCFTFEGQTTGIGAGQQSRIHCTRLAGSKSDTWFLRQHPKVLNLSFKSDISRATRDNVIENYINKNEEDVCADKIWQNYFEKRPEVLTQEEISEYLSNLDNVILGSDAFFPFSDNIIRAKKSGVRYIVQVGGSVNDDKVIETCDEYNMVSVFTNLRLFHH